MSRLPSSSLCLDPRAFTDLSSTGCNYQFWDSNLVPSIPKPTINHMQLIQSGFIMQKYYSFSFFLSRWMDRWMDGWIDHISYMLDWQIYRCQHGLQQGWVEAGSTVSAAVSFNNNKKHTGARGKRSRWSRTQYYQWECTKKNWNRLCNFGNPIT